VGNSAVKKSIRAPEPVDKSAEPKNPPPGERRGASGSQGGGNDQSLTDIKGKRNEKIAQEGFER